MACFPENSPGCRGRHLLPRAVSESKFVISSRAPWPDYFLNPQGNSTLISPNRSFFSPCRAGAPTIIPTSRRVQSSSSSGDTNELTTSFTICAQYLAAIYLCFKTYPVKVTSPIRPPSRSPFLWFQLACGRSAPIMCRRVRGRAGG